MLRSKMFKSDLSQLSPFGDQRYSNARCSCGVLEVVSRLSSGEVFLIRLTQVKVVVLCVANEHETANDVDDSLTGVSDPDHTRMWSGSLRIAEGFLPMYRA